MSSMSDSGGGGRAGAELMVEQFHLKVLHAVLAVRSPRPLAAPAPPAAASASFRRRDRWFHLPLHDPPPPPSAERLEAPSPGEPLVVDIHLAPAGNGGCGRGGGGEMDGCVRALAGRCDGGRGDSREPGVQAVHDPAEGGVRHAPSAPGVPRLP
ncbi:hypothetical protein ACQ4PT_016115 [Festuca glaucescens]